MTARGAISVLLAAQLLWGCSTTNAGIRVIDPWASRPAGSMASVIAGFLCFQNDGSLPIRIVSASSDAVKRVEIHEIVHEQGIVRMKKADGVDVPPNSTVCLEPEHVHFMLIGIDDTIRTGADIRLKINTATGDVISAVLPQRTLTNLD